MVYLQQLLRVFYFNPPFPPIGYFFTLGVVGGNTAQIREVEVITHLCILMFFLDTVIVQTMTKFRNY